FRQQRPVVACLATAALVAIGGEVLLGAGVVVNELASWLVLVHLGLAMVILGFLLATAIMSLPASSGRSIAMPATAAAATFVLLLTGLPVVGRSDDWSELTWR